MKRLLLATAALLLATKATAATVGADGASASSEFSPAYDPRNTIDGSGLSTANDPAATHADYTVNNHWTTGSGPVVGQWIEWSFSTPQTLGGLYIWNHRSNIIAASAGYEPTLFGLEFKDATSSVLLSFTNVGLLPDTNLSQAFTLNTAVSNVSAVRFTVEATQAANTPYTGLAEVLFDDQTIAGATSLAAPIPLPAGLPLLLAGLGGLALLRRKS